MLSVALFGLLPILLVLAIAAVLYTKQSASRALLSGAAEQRPWLHVVRLLRESLGHVASREAAELSSSLLSKSLAPFRPTGGPSNSLRMIARSSRGELLHFDVTETQAHLPWVGLVYEISSDGGWPAGLSIELIQGRGGEIVWMGQRVRLSPEQCVRCFEVDESIFTLLSASQFRQLNVNDQRLTLCVAEVIAVDPHGNVDEDAVVKLLLRWLALRQLSAKLLAELNTQRLVQGLLRVFDDSPKVSWDHPLRPIFTAMLSPGSRWTVELGAQLKARLQDAIARQEPDALLLWLSWFEEPIQLNVIKPEVVAPLGAGLEQHPALLERALPWALELLKPLFKQPVQYPRLNAALLMHEFERLAPPSRARFLNALLEREYIGLQAQRLAALSAHHEPTPLWIELFLAYPLEPLGVASVSEPELSDAVAMVNALWRLVQRCEPITDAEIALQICRKLAALLDTLASTHMLRIAVSLEPFGVSAFEFIARYGDVEALTKLHQRAQYPGTRPSLAQAATRHAAILHRRLADQGLMGAVGALSVAEGALDVGGLSVVQPAAGQLSMLQPRAADEEPA